MDTIRHEHIRACAGERISSKKIKDYRSIRRRQDDEQDEVNDDENDEENGENQVGKGKGKGKGQGKFGPPAPTPGLAGNEQAPSPSPPPPPIPVAPSTVTSPTVISTALPPPSPEASTTTSVVISTLVATDSTTSVQTSFITITQSTVLKLDSIVTTTTSVNSFPILSSPMASDVIVSSASTEVVASPTIEPLPPPGESDNSRQAISMDPPISPIARNLLIALGVMGAISLLITAAIIVMQRSKKRSSHRVARRTESKDNPLQGQNETSHGVITEITALPRGQSFQTAKSPTGTKMETRTVSRLNGQATTGTTMDQSETAVPLHKDGKTFSDALNSFMEKARNSSYSYKIGP